MDGEHEAPGSGHGSGAGEAHEARATSWDQARKREQSTQQAASGQQANRLDLLHGLIAALSGAMSVGAVADVIITHGLAALQANAGVIAVANDDGSSFTNVRVTGYPDEVVAAYPSFPRDAALPLAAAIRMRAAVIYETRAAHDADYPHVANVHTRDGARALVALPLHAGERVVGGLGMSFADDRAFDGDDRAFMRTLAELCGQALERAHLYEEERAARTAAEAQWRRLQQVIDVLPEAVLIADMTPQFLMCNAAAQTIMGADVTGTPVAQREDQLLPGSGVWHADGTPRAIEDLPLQRALFRGETVQGEQLVVRNGETGVDTPVLANSAPLRDEDGAISGAVAVFQDISLFKDLERQRDEVVGTISHDLRNPLTALIGMTQILQRRAESLTEDDRTRMVDGLGWMLQTAHRMNRQINGLLDVTRLRMERPLELERSPVDLVALLTRQLAEYQQTTERHTLRLESAEQALIGQVDDARLERAIANVLSNALKYSPGGGTISVSLTQSDEASGTWATIRIADQGVGIPPDDLPRIFERYFRASNVAVRVTGTGLGLFGVRQIVEQHGGSIAIESALGEGTTVTIRVPLHP